MRSGTYDVALTVQRRDEIGVLAEGLQLMQMAVKSRDQSIRMIRICNKPPTVLNP
jgi:hypothetical protein